MKLKNIFIIAVVLMLVITLVACQKPDVSVGETSIYDKYPGAHILKLSGNTATLDGVSLEEFDYTWRADPTLDGVLFNGTAPSEDLNAYVAHDIIYYPEIDESSFTKENYDGEEEWVTRFTAEGLQEYIFGTLPVLGTDLPTEMMHSANDAYNNPVIHITQPGEYIIEGTFNGQLFFDFGDEEDTFENKDASVKVILNGANVTCSVAPAIIFHDVYECDNTWESRDSYTDSVDLSDAGVNIVIADGTENSFSGCNVYRLLKAEYKKGSTTVQKKLWKTDGAFYSFQSMAINAEEKGTGILNITSQTFEGLDSELHMTIIGGYVNIYSIDDGINVNEDNVSVFTQNGGHLTIFASLGAEGDVIDSNGYIRINAGVLAGTSKSPSDDMLDSEKGTYVSESANIIYGGSLTDGDKFRGRGDMPPEGSIGDSGDMPPERPIGDPGDMPPERPIGDPGDMPPEKPIGYSNGFDE